jgi:hypothetical protein
VHFRVFFVFSSPLIYYYEFALIYAGRSFLTEQACKNNSYATGVFMALNSCQEGLIVTSCSGKLCFTYFC